MDGTITPSPKAVEWLKSQPNQQMAIETFDLQYGEGAANSILGVTPEVTPTVEPEAELTFLEKAGDVAMAIPRGIEDALVAGFTTIDDLNNLGGGFTWGNGTGLNWVTAEEKAQLREQGKLKPELMFGYFKDVNEFADESKTVTGNVVQGITNYVAPYTAVMYGFGVRATFLTASAVGGMTGGVFIDPDDKNLANLANDYGINPMGLSELLMTDPDGDKWENRWNNVMLDVAGGAAIEGTIRGMAYVYRGMRKYKNAKTPEEKAAALKEVEEAQANLEAQTNEVVRATQADAQDTIELAEKALKDEPEAVKTTAKDSPYPDKTPDRPFKFSDEEIQGILDDIKGGSDASGVMGPSKLVFRSVSNFGSPDEVMDYLNKVATLRSEELTKIKGGAVRKDVNVKAQAARKVKDLIARAKEDIDPEAFINHVKEMFPDPVDMDAKIRVLAAFIDDLSATTEKLAKRIVDNNFEGDGLIEAKLELAANSELLAELFSVYNRQSASTGRVLRTFSEIKKHNPAMKRLISQSLDNTDINSLAKHIAEGRDAVEVALASTPRLQKVLDSVNRVRISSMLSGVGTFMVNIVSPLLNQVITPIQYGLTKPKHAARQLYHQTTALGEVYRTMIKAWNEDEAILDITASKFDYDVNKGAKSLPNKVIGLPMRVLLAQDELIKGATYRGRIIADALEEADNLKLTGKARKDHVNEALENAYTKSGHATNEEALRYAQEITFTRNLEGALGHFQHATINKGGLWGFGWQQVIPFFKTPVNILSQSFQHVPALQFLSKDFRTKIAAGGIDRSIAIGRLVTGGAIVAGLMSNMENDRFIITGNGPRDPRLRGNWLGNNRPLSVGVRQEDGTINWYSYGRLEPIANAVAMVADARYFMSDEFQQNHEEAPNVFASMALAIAANSTNKTFTKSINDFIQIFAMEEEGTRLNKALQSYFGSFIPNILNQTNGDEYYRSVQDYWDVLYSRTFFPEGVDPKRNALAEMIPRTNQKYDPLGIFTPRGLPSQDNPVTRTTQVDPVLREMSRLERVSGSPFGPLVSPSYSLNFDKTDLRKIPYKEGETQSMHDHLLEKIAGNPNMGIEPIRLEGKTMREMLAELMQTDTYQDPSRSDGVQGDITQDTRRGLVNKIRRTYAEIAKASSPEFQEFLVERKKKQIEMRMNPQINGFKSFNDTFSTE